MQEIDIPTAHSAHAAQPAHPNVPMLDLKRQYRVLHQELLDALGRVLETQEFILGEHVAAFERAAAEQLGVAHALGCSSGTDALWLALAAAEIVPGQAVVTTPFSFFASVSSVLRAGATPVLADIDPVTFNLSPRAVDAVLNGSRGTYVRAILPVHLYGQCADWDCFAELGRKRGLILIEDAAQAWGAAWKGKKAGGLGDVAAFSFYPTKNLSAAGDAGMVTTNSAELAERVKMLRQHGMRRRYHHDELGWNTRMDGFQGAVLQVKLKYIEAWNEARRTLAARYHALFAKDGLAEAGPYPQQGVVLPREVEGARHIWHQYVIRVSRRDALREFLTARGIGSEIYYPVPLHLQEALKGLGYKEGDFPEAERAAREVLALPIFPELREDEQETVVGAIAEFLS
ncbi:Pleiotropic regulatory protein [Candidatus Sulfotelmatomonas gaucii]|uniref:Pleiotropic regulatory protein n=1 Tax=Candidatus Sulfuritelmatomonas gaucii TaxID=2043161 RepID=A0A2N9LB78_9BACT|nr:Pleiotropic regulatory protein [Candidatus Sulfotelmatomonas gaucii]